MRAVIAARGLPLQCEIARPTAASASARISTPQSAFSGAPHQPRPNRVVLLDSRAHNFLFGARGGNGGLSAIKE